MKFIIDLEILSENKLSLVQFATLINIYNKVEFFGGIDYNLVILPLQELGFIKLIMDGYIERKILREKGKLLVESMTYKDESWQPNVQVYTHKEVKSESNTSSYMDFIKEYRNLWKGLKLGSMGSLNACAIKMKKWMKENPDFNQEDIMRAAKNYIDSTDDLKYLQQADYFIYKKDKFGESSRLSAIIEEPVQKQQGWSSELK